MADGVMLLLGAAALLLVLVILGGAVQIYADAGPRVFYWPRFDHGYEIQHATRLATLPWYLVLFLVAVNGLAIMLFAHDILGQPSTAWGFWLAAMLVPIGMVHFLDYCHSRIAAILTLLLVAAAVGAAVWITRSWIPAAIGAPVLLWSLNGVRATFARHMYG